MQSFEWLSNWIKNPQIQSDENIRKFRLINIITFELILFGLVLLYLSAFLEFWFIFGLLLIGLILGFFNLLLLKNHNNSFVSGHIICALILMVITLGNLWIGGLPTSYFSWFYIPPLIAAVTLGMEGLIIYSSLSALIMLFFMLGFIAPTHLLPAVYIQILNIINHGFILLIIFTTLYSLIIENKHYETLLKEQNYLLYADKQKFHYLSTHDSLTNLPNRSYFLSHLQSMIDSINKEIHILTLYYMDLDGFKLINDKYGHEIGDLLLLQVSKRLQSSFRGKDFISRIGGDEFTAITLHHPEDNIAETLTKRIENEFKEPFLIKNLEISCTISIGIANYPKDSLNAETLIKIADYAMYHNKKLKYASPGHS